MFTLLGCIAFALMFPDFLAGHFVKREYKPRPAVDELYVKSIFVKERGCCHDKVEVKSAVTLGEIGMPNLISLKIITDEIPCSKECPDMLAVRYWRWRSKITFTPTNNSVSMCYSPLPEFFTFSADTHQNQCVAFSGSEENVILPNNRRRGSFTKEWETPLDIFGLTPLNRDIGSLADTVVVWPAPPVPITGETVAYKDENRE